MPPAAFGLTQEEFETKTGVLLLYGKNSFGDRIYSYVQITIPNLRRMKLAIASGETFTPSDFGTVIAAGRGDPDEETRNEMTRLHAVTHTRAAEPATAQMAPAPAPLAKKSWDEY